MSDLTALPRGLEVPARTCRAVIERSQAARGEYASDPHLKAFTLKWLLQPA